MNVDFWPALTVFLYALLTAVTTGLGALPLLVMRQPSKFWLGVGDATAAGLMLAASMNLIAEGNREGPFRVVAGVVVGLLLIMASRWWLDRRETPEVGQLAGANAMKALLIVGVMTMHSFAEGIGVGVSFGGGQELGVFISIAIAVHNIPEGLAISLVLVPKGMPVWKAGWWSIFSSLPQPLMAVPAFLFVQVFRPALPFGFGLAAGAMLWMVVSELLPESLEDLKPSQAAAVVTVAVAAMLLFQGILGQIINGAG